jgi:magnesium chelatase family protein
VTLATVLSRGQFGFQAPLVSVEVHIGPGLPQISLVGLASGSTRDSRERVRAAIVSAGFEWPAGRITVNLAPADLPKEGGRYDLAVALGVLIASEQLAVEGIDGWEFLGELSLSGELRGSRGLVPAIVHATQARRAVVLPEPALPEARIVPGARLVAARDLRQVVAHLRRQETLPFADLDAEQPAPADSAPDLDAVRGQQAAKRALALAAAGGHSLLMIGPPGAGKSMLAARLPALLPPLSRQEALESAMLASLAQPRGRPVLSRSRAFRAPHHTATCAALIGGGATLRPGEASLAHHGVLFLDELPEFGREAREALREPLETEVISLARAARSATFPASFQLVAAMNPCPCGYAGDPSGRCRCTPAQIARYVGRLSGPLIDRLDLHIEVPRVDFATLSMARDAGGSHGLVEAVLAARARQLERQQALNARLPASQVDQHARPDDAGRALLARAAASLGLSARACHRVLRVARTIADLDASERVAAEHVAEAITYRRLDRRPAPER